MPAQPARAEARKPAKCPICGLRSDGKYKPFCSRRCADVDLSRWLGGAYAIPDTTESEDGGEGSSKGSDWGSDWGSDPAGLTPGESGAKSRER